MGMKCNKCGNEDRKLFSYVGDRLYCRSCIHLLGKLDEEGFVYQEGELKVGFKLSEEQETISSELVNFTGSKCLVEAVCGSGKTEICLEVVNKYLTMEKRVGWMCPRKQVVLQLYERLKEYFIGYHVSCVVGGMSHDLTGQLVCLTGHQLYRYPESFDLLIVDEPDAFPFAGNELLERLVQRSCIGQMVYLSATPQQSIIDNVDKIFRLDRRYHGRKLVEPFVYTSYSIFVYIKFLILINRLKGGLIFVGSKDIGLKLSKLLRFQLLTSDTVNKSNIIDMFLSGGGWLICTTVLERGVTFSDINVIVLGADYITFDESSLTQIAGRVDRKMEKSNGQCWFLSFSKSKEVEACVKRITLHNKRAFGV